MKLISKKIVRRKELLLVLMFEFLIFAGLTLIAAQQSTYQPTKIIEVNVQTNVYFNYMGWNGENIVLLQTNYVDSSQYYFIVEIDENGEVISNNSLPIENIEWVTGFYATADNYYILGENDSVNLIEIIILSKDFQVVDSYNITSILGKKVSVSEIAYNGSIYWIVENQYGTSAAHLLGIDVEQNELIANITLSPPSNVQVYEYYISGLAFGRDSLWVVDSSNRLLRVFPNETSIQVMNITEALLPYFTDRNITDFYIGSVALSEDTLWVSAYYYSSEFQSEKTVIFGFDLNEIAPLPTPPENIEQFTPENERVENATSSATQSAVSGLVAAATTTIAVSSVSTVSAMTTTTVSTTTTTAATTGAATGAQTARENILTQLKNLFSLRKLKNLFRKKKEEEKEEQVKPNFALATGVITLLGAIVGAVIATVLYGFGNIGALLNGIATGVGLPLSIFGLITGLFTFSLIIRKKIEAKTFTKIATIISIIASLYGLFTAPLALATMYPFEVTALYGGFAVAFAGYLAAIQISDFIRLLASILNR